MGDKPNEHQATVIIETRSLAPAQSDQVRTRRQGNAALSDRGPEIEAAIEEMSEILRKSAEAQVSQWSGSLEIEAKFGLTLGLEQGILFSKIDASASFEVTIKVQLASAL